jgi:hypothetical protein
MDDSDKPKFVITIGAMFETFGQEATKAILHGYWLGLNDLGLEQVQIAVAKAIRTCKHAPKPAELRELAGCGKENAEDLAFRAWTEALDAVSLGPYRHIDFDDKCVNAVIRSMGGWPTFVARFTDGESEKWARLDFVKLYKCYADRPVSDEAIAPLPGLSQFESSSIDRKPVPVRIKCKDAPRLALANRVPENVAISFRRA